MTPKYKNGNEIDTTPFTEDEVLEQLAKLKVDKAMGPDGIHPEILKELREVLAGPIKDVFNRSFETGEVPQDWRMADVVPLHKSGDREEVSNYRPVSLTLVAGKVMERIMNFLKTKRLQDPRKHGFTEGRSCQANLIEFFDWVTRELDQGHAMDVIYLDFRKAFDTVPHRRLISKLSSLRTDPKMVKIGSEIG